jgi:hypothetical protein
MNNMRVEQKSKTIWKKDKLSGHEWAEVRLLHRWEVHGPTGSYGTFNSYEKAVKIAEECETFYKKFPFETT